MVPNITIDENFNGNNVTLTLNWGEPFNNFDSIVKYTVSCVGDTYVRNCLDYKTNHFSNIQIWINSTNFVLRRHNLATTSIFLY